MGSHSVVVTSSYSRESYPPALGGSYLSYDDPYDDPPVRYAEISSSW
jgi:hypothetical protein|tara:strand:+ start:1950 stop:2090 length:141 start_codon:yes stop_codon:yes gene_type:complete